MVEEEETLREVCLRSRPDDPPRAHYVEPQAVLFPLFYVFIART